jgi:hypothetical protein
LKWTVGLAELVIWHSGCLVRWDPKLRLEIGSVHSAGMVLADGPELLVLPPVHFPLDWWVPLDRSLHWALDWKAR